MSEPVREPAPNAPRHDAPLDLTAPAPPALVELAAAYGVATEFTDWQDRPAAVATSTVAAVLTALEVDVSTHGTVAAALTEVAERPWRQVLPDVTVLRQGRASTVTLHVPEGRRPEVRVDLEDGERLALAVRNGPSARRVDGVLRTELVADLPDDLPLGWHELRASDGGDGPDEVRPLVVTPDVLALPGGLGEDRAWGFMTQLYQVRSRASWGLGDLADLAELAAWSASHGAGFLLVNPLHAAEPVPPMTPSPYLPTTRRFANPVYLRVEDVREAAYLPGTERAVLEWRAESMRALDTDPGELDRDAVWEAKRSALRSVFDHGRSPARQAAFDRFRRQEGQGLRDYATWCALAEQHGLPTRRWPAPLLDPASAEVAGFREEYADDIAFHEWMQWCLDEQLQRAQRTATDSGMPLGVVHDLAVGVHPDGADVWTLGRALARGVTVGAPPDAFNQQGQDWSQPPWRPDHLERLGYAPFRDMLRTVLRHCGGLRVDHVLGLFRLWWIPQGAGAGAGTYVKYDHEALLGILALEAQRAGALVVGEDLGNVEPWIQDYLLERGLLGTSILWFEKDEHNAPRRPEKWRRLALATVASHDLPPTAGYLAGSHIELRSRLGLLTRPAEEEAEIDRKDQAAFLAMLRDMHLLGSDPSEQEIIEALNAALTRSPSILLGALLTDAVGDRRTINQPGTDDEYPNWRLPLTDGQGRVVLVEDLLVSPRAVSLARAVNRSTGPASP